MSSQLGRASRPEFSSTWWPRAIVGALAVGMATVLALTGVVRWTMPAEIVTPVADAGWTGRTHAWMIPRGFLGAEVSVDGLQFSWTSARARIQFPHLDRTRAYRVGVEVSAFRPPPTPPPQVTVGVDREGSVTEPTSPLPRIVWIDLPVRSESGALVTLDSSDTFVPGGGDPRALGVMVTAVHLAPVDGRFSLDWAELGLAALGAAALAFGVLSCGVAPLLAAFVLPAIVVVWVTLLRLDAAFIGVEATRLAEVGAAAAVIGALVGLARTRWVSQRLPEWPEAMGVTLGLSALKLACFTHPQIALTDAMFQVHRAMVVHRGEYFFTSVTPSPSFEFPYAVALYVAARPFWSWFPADLDLANLLRGLSLVADAGVGLAVYAAARRCWSRRSVALLCAALWPLARGPAMALGHANLTNLFGQGLFGVAMGMVAYAAAGATPAWPLVGIAGGVLTLAFLSHFSTLTVGLLLVSAVAVSWFLFARPGGRRLGVGLILVLCAAAAVAYAVYYSHFNTLYRQTFLRVVSGADRVSDTSMVAPPALKWRRWITEDQFSNDYGLPGVATFVAAIAGAWWLRRERRREPLTVMLLAWAGVWCVASALGIFTSVEVRANLAAAPMFVALAAYGVDTALRRRGLYRVVAALVLVAMAWSGVRVWTWWLWGA